MKIKFVLYLLFSMFISLFLSCNDNKNINEEIDGASTDIIKLSTKELELAKEGDTKIVTTEYANWRILDVSSKIYEIKHHEVNGNIINGDWFVIDKTDDKTLKISINNNTDLVERYITITVTSGNYFDYIQITQKSK